MSSFYELVFNKTSTNNVQLIVTNVKRMFDIEKRKLKNTKFLILFPLKATIDVLRTV